jgi:multidrug efflux system outer membrane protein
LFKERAQSGLTSELDVSRAETELAEVEAEMAAARRRRASSEATLAILVGEPAARFFIEPKLVRIKVPEIAAGLPSTLLERRPDVAEAERKLAARNAEIGVAYAAFFPSIRLTASGGFQSVELKDLFSWESRVWSFGPNVSLPLFAGGRNAAALRQARAAYEEAVATYRQSLLVAFSEVDDSLAGLLYLREELTAQARATAAARKASTLSIDRYQAGIINYLELIDTERNRLENEVRLVQITAQQLITTVQLIKALGGGWDPATAGATSPHSL